MHKEKNLFESSLNLLDDDDVYLNNISLHYFSGVNRDVIECIITIPYKSFTLVREYICDEDVSYQYDCNIDGYSYTFNTSSDIDIDEAIKIFQDL